MSDSQLAIGPAGPVEAGDQPAGSARGSADFESSLAPTRVELPLEHDSETNASKSRAASVRIGRRPIPRCSTTEPPAIFARHGRHAPVDALPARRSHLARRARHALAAAALRPQRSKWADLLKRVFEIVVLARPWCGGKRKLIALLTGGAVVRRILAHLGLPTTAPTLAPARAPPELEFAG